MKLVKFPFAAWNAESLQESTLTSLACCLASVQCSAYAPPKGLSQSACSILSRTLGAPRRCTPSVRGRPTRARAPEGGRGRALTCQAPAGCGDVGAQQGGVERPRHGAPLQQGGREGGRHHNVGERDACRQQRRLQLRVCPAHRCKTPNPRKPGLPELETVRN